MSEDILRELQASGTVAVSMIEALIAMAGPLSGSAQAAADNKDSGEDTLALQLRLVLWRMYWA